MEKNNLDKLYQEKLKDFHEVPDERVWESIAASLDKKKKKRVIPIWWRLGGIAALLAVLFYVVNPFEKTTEPNQQIVTEIENDTAIPETDETQGEELLTPVPNHMQKSNADQIADIDSTKNQNNARTPVTEVVDNINKNTSKNNPLPQNQARENTVQITSNSNTATKEKAFDLNKEDKINEDFSNVSKEAVAENNTDIQTKVDDRQDKITLDRNQIETTVEEAVAEVTEETKEEDGQEGKKSIFEVIEEDEEVADNDPSKGKWSVGPSVAPVYFNAVGEGSPIHSNFVENTKSGNLNLSYGLSVSYNLSKRLTVRSGVHRVDYGYDTNDIVFSASLTGSTNGLIDNIDYSQTSRNLVVESKNKMVADSPTDTFSSVSAESLARDGRMVQDLGYLEVPLELNYALIDKKFGVSLIGGVSSLFLIDNSVALEGTDGLVTEMGEANNVNAVNFSTNVGVGLNYNFSPKVQLNLEPVFKYQLNTFSETAGSFNPYSIGVYSGLRFKF